MIAVERLHTHFLLSANHRDKQYLKNLVPSQRDAYFNRAKDWIIEHLAPLAETNEEVRNLLLPWTKRKVVLTQNGGGTDYIKYSLPTDYFRSLRYEAIAAVEGCENRLMKVRRPPSDKLTDASHSSLWNPSWEWEETLGQEGDDGFRVFFTDFSIVQVFLDYVRKVKDVASPEIEPNYQNDAGEFVATNQDFEGEETLFRRILDLAVLMAQRDNEEVSNFQTQAALIALGRQ